MYNSNFEDIQDYKPFLQRSCGTREVAHNHKRDVAEERPIFWSNQELAFGFPVKGEEAEPPLAFNVGGLDHASAEGASPWSWLPGQHPLILIAHEHQTHLVTSFSGGLGRLYRERKNEVSWNLRFPWGLACYGGEPRASRRF